MKKDTYIKIRCSNKQKQYIQNVSNDLGLSITDYILSKCVPTETNSVSTGVKTTLVPTEMVPKPKTNSVDISIKRRMLSVEEARRKVSQRCK